MSIRNKTNRAEDFHFFTVIRDEQRRPVITVCTVLDTDGAAHRGIAVCSPLDFSHITHEEGRARAYGRALRAMKSGRSRLFHFPNGQRLPMAMFDRMRDVVKTDMQSVAKMEYCCPLSAEEQSRAADIREWRAAQDKKAAGLARAEQEAVTKFREKTRKDDRQTALNTAGARNERDCGLAFD